MTAITTRETQSIAAAFQPELGSILEQIQASGAACKRELQGNINALSARQAALPIWYKGELLDLWRTDMIAWTSFILVWGWTKEKTRISGC
jgi:hypothetical protein